uniref:Uncharacterized protein n=1 Tax=Oryzias sinensis TaxID=183150 RepID=A0A8C7X1U0_9TELE
MWKLLIYAKGKVKVELSFCWPGGCVGRRVWILLAMTHLTLDFSACSPLSQGGKLTSKAAPRSRPRLQPLWDMPNKLQWRTVSPLARRFLHPVPPPQDNRVGAAQKVKNQKFHKAAHKGPTVCKDCPLGDSRMETADPLTGREEVPAASPRRRFFIRARRQLKWDSYDRSQEGRTTTVPGFIDWGPTGTDSVDDDGKGGPNVTLSTRASSVTTATTAGTTPRLSQRTLTVVTTPESRSTTKSPHSHSETATPPRHGDPPGKTHGRSNTFNNWGVSDFVAVFRLSALPSCIDAKMETCWSFAFVKLTHKLDLQ